MDEERCEQLMEEYETLRRRLEAVDFAQEDRPEDIFDEDEALSFEELDVDPEDIRRFDEVQRLLMEECDADLPVDDEEGIDLPDYVWDGITQE